MKLFPQAITLIMITMISLAVQAGPAWKKSVTIPVVDEGAACNSTTDKIGIAASNVLLSCQSGVWRSQAQGLGYGQAWQDVTSSRSPGVTYTNTTGRPIVVSAEGVCHSISTIAMMVNGVVIYGSTTYVTPGGVYVTNIVPVGASYSVYCLVGVTAISNWAELR